MGHDINIFIQVKTTSPGKFKVRLSSGVLLPQEQRTISVVVQQEHNMRGLLQVDKFLVMCLPLKDPNASAQELAALWKVIIHVNYISLYNSNMLLNC